MTEQNSLKDLVSLATQFNAVAQQKIMGLQDDALLDQVQEAIDKLAPEIEALQKSVPEPGQDVEDAGDILLEIEKRQMMQQLFDMGLEGQTVAVQDPDGNVIEITVEAPEEVDTAEEQAKAEAAMATLDAYAKQIAPIALPVYIQIQDKVASVLLDYIPADQRDDLVSDEVRSTETSDAFTENNAPTFAKVFAPQP